MTLRLAILLTARRPHHRRARANKLVAIRAAHLLDVKSGRMLRDAVVVIDGDKIRAAGEQAGRAAPAPR